MLSADLLKVILFARSQISLIIFCTELCAEIGIIFFFLSNFVKLCQKYENVLVLQVYVQKLKILRRCDVMCSVFNVHVQC